MKKKPVKKKAVGGLLGVMADKDIMPMGIIPQLLYKRREDKKDNAASAAAARNEQIMQQAAARGRAANNAAPRRMKKGGKVDGCAIRGKTRGRLT